MEVAWNNFQSLDPLLQVRVLTLAKNRGKGGAVRMGMLRARWRIGILFYHIFRVLLFRVLLYRTLLYQYFSNQLACDFLTSVSCVCLKLLLSRFLASVHDIDNYPRGENLLFADADGATTFSDLSKLEEAIGGVAKDGQVRSEDSQTVRQTN